MSEKDSLQSKPIMISGVIKVNGTPVFLEDIQEAVNMQSQAYIAAFTPALVQGLLDEISRLKALVKGLSQK